jgi:hypothetical protein
LEQASAAADALLSAHQARGETPLVGDPGWDEIEPGLACGGRACLTAALESSCFERVLNLTGRPDTAGQCKPFPLVVGCGLRQEGPIDAAACQAAVAWLRRWRDEGRSVLVCCEDGKSLSALVVALSLMAERGWDFPEAMWYIRQRRRGAWPRPQILQGLVISGLERG